MPSKIYRSCLRCIGELAGSQFSTLKFKQHSTQRLKRNQNSAPTQTIRPPRSGTFAKKLVKPSPLKSHMAPIPFGSVTKSYKPVTTTTKTSSTVIWELFVPSLQTALALRSNLPARSLSTRRVNCQKSSWPIASPSIRAKVASILLSSSHC